MNRLGTALTPLLLRAEVASGALDLDPRRWCARRPSSRSRTFRGARSSTSRCRPPRRPVWTSRCKASTAPTTAPAGQPLSAVQSLVSVPAAQWGQASDVGTLDLNVGQAVRFGVQVARSGAGSVGPLRQPLRAARAHRQPHRRRLAALTSSDAMLQMRRVGRLRRMRRCVDGRTAARGASRPSRHRAATTTSPSSITSADGRSRTIQRGSRCYCHYFHVAPALDWSSLAADANRAAIAARIDVGEMEGFLAHDDAGRVVGWLNAQPRHKLPHCFARLEVPPTPHRRAGARSRRRPVLRRRSRVAPAGRRARAARRTRSASFAQRGIRVVDAFPVARPADSAAAHVSRAARDSTSRSASRASRAHGDTVAMRKTAAMNAPERRRALRACRTCWSRSTPPRSRSRACSRSATG